MYQRHELFANLSPEDTAATLKACGLPEKDEYMEDEADRFRECRSLIEQGKSYKQAAAHFRQQDKKHKQQTGASEPEAKSLDISELLAFASGQCGSRVSLKEAVQILAVCGLPDSEQYTPDECDRFLEACALLKQQGKSDEEVAEHFGVKGTSELGLNHLLEQIGDSTITAESGLRNLVDKVTDKRAISIPGIVNQMYLKNVSRHLAENQANTEMFFAELEQRLMDYIEGKSQARSLDTTWEWAPNSLPPSSPKPISLPEDLDNGTSAQ